MIKPDILIVECKTWQETEISAKKGIGDGYCAISSGAGLVLLRDKPYAMKLFVELSESYLTHKGEDMIAHCLATDGQGTECIVFALGTPQVTSLYGVTGLEYDEFIQSLQKPCPDCGHVHSKFGPPPGGSGKIH